ncbi:hypothetical protein EVAR_103707_1 [Eumeta japonica]|uniref:Uncharacterized protein n=1 Tax=Eumeta variegata TaxID=151549 RepID=A0A4C1ZIY9_EUMVA|nr:hypothetical protein EVAR_103707_1 [Eumeta japonica]
MPTLEVGTQAFVLVEAFAAMRVLWRARKGAVTGLLRAFLCHARSINVDVGVGIGIESGIGTGPDRTDIESGTVIVARVNSEIRQCKIKVTCKKFVYVQCSARIGRSSCVRQRYYVLELFAHSSCIVDRADDG